jgi:hypothetical protein
MTIHNFTGEYAFLSNFYERPVTIGGITFPTAEHAFQAAKCANAGDVARIHSMATPGGAKRMGRKITMRSDWEEVKFDAMVAVVSAKFQNRELADKLVATGDQELVEGNTWGDKTWGRVAGKGQNWLGKILMAERAAIIADRLDNE